MELRDNKRESSCASRLETNRIDETSVLENSNSDQECKHEFVFFKEAPTDIGVEAEGEEVVDILNSLGHIIWKETMVRNE
ncbi:hypothetical protein T265_04420 [Opisthorchis viverrini]|uniref:Uncharacterized protein n=1 Tax=Opisthorchis viverrini TaxID=6198 RepID=A0A074ZSK9_OPIVI|nr:hypothetical protein T265_04420 [Opisthorchis viverrini]KER28812.1 hypothetical protein T265_04420 [Opisthorchis viverrini]